MSGPRERILRILALFERKPAWTIQELANEIGVSASSIYRDTQVLSSAAFLHPDTEATYWLGPAFIRFDALIRENDPLTAIAAPQMRRLLERTTQEATAVLCRIYRDRVMCVHQEEGRAPHAPTSYQRGVALSLFRGATSKAILAQFSDRALRALYRKYKTIIESETNCSSWPDLREELKAIRNQGYACTTSEVAPGLAGVATPIFHGSQVVAGLSLVTQAKRADPTFIRRAAHALQQASDHISDALAASASRDRFAPNEPRGPASRKV